MKNLSFALSAAFVLFALASCQKEKEVNENVQALEIEQVGSIPFQFVATINGEDATETKTSLNTTSWAVTWDSTDKIYAVVTDATNENNPNWGSGDSSSDKDGNKVAEFSYSSGAFSTETAITDGSHVFNFIYSNAAQKKYHRATGTSHQLYSSQSVNASDPAANLKNYDALVGTKTITTPAALATVDLHHIYSLMKVTISNTTGAELIATKFKVNFEGANIAGVFSVTDFSTGAISLTSGGTSTIEVPITNGTIANGNSIDVYFAMAPLADYSGDVTFTVIDSNDFTYSKTNPITSKSFEAGKYNTATFVVKPALKQAGMRFERISTINNLVSGDYMILGTKEVNASYGFMRYASMSSSRIPYSADYNSETAIPSVKEGISNIDAYWNLTVSGSGDERTVTIYNEAKGEYLKCDGSGNLSWVNALAGANTNFTVTEGTNGFSFEGAKNTLNINKSSDWWKCYAASSTNTTSGIILYQNWETSTLSSIALEGTYKTAFTVGDSFDWDGLLVKATYANSKTRYVTPTSVSEGGSAPDMSSARAGVTITVSYTEAGVTKNATYTIDITAASNFTVTWKIGSTTYQTDSDVVGGSALVLPSVPAAGDLTAAGFDGKAFMGWTSDATVASNGSGITYATGAETVDDNITYYAVVATAGSPASETLNIQTVGTANSWTNSTIHTPIVVGDVTFTASGGGTNGRYHTTDFTWRFYTSGVCTISTPVGCVITSVVVEWATSAFTAPAGWSVSTTENTSTYTPNSTTKSNVCALSRGTSNVLSKNYVVSYTPYSAYAK